MKMKLAGWHLRWQKNMEKLKIKNKDCIQKWVWSFYFVRNLFVDSLQIVRSLFGTDGIKNGKTLIFPMMQQCRCDNCHNLYCYFLMKIKCVR